MRILYIGSSGELSLQPLRYLLQSEHTLCAVAVDVPTAGSYSDPRLPVLNEHDDSVATLARQSGLPIIDLSDPLPTCLAAIVKSQADLILVSCYGKKLPQPIIDLPASGCFNLHPSHLPAYRGPVPVFWQFRDGLTEFGVSLHVMTAALDAGPVVASSRVAMPDGISQARAHQLLAEAYLRLLPGFFNALGKHSLDLLAQDESAMSYHGYPEAEDFRVDTRWSARRIFNFISATQHWGRVYPCRIDQIDYPLHTVLGFSDEQCPHQNCVIDGTTIEIACHPGQLLARLAPV